MANSSSGKFNGVYVVQTFALNHKRLTFASPSFFLKKSIFLKFEKFQISLPFLIKMLGPIKIPKLLEF